MSFGLTDDGFKIKRLRDIKSELESSYRDIFGDIRTDAESNAGQQIGIQSESLSLIWELLQNIYLNQYPTTASGLSLDYLLLLNGLTRLPATATEVWVGLEVTNGSYIPDSFLVQDSVSKNFKILSDITINYSELNKIYFTIASVEENSTYTISLNGNNYSITSDFTPTKIEIAQLLVDNINADLNAEYEASIVDSDSIMIYSNSIFSYNVSTSNLVMKIGLPFQCTTKGETPAIVGTIENIATGVSGVSSVYNFEEGVVGRGIETDDEARVRRLASLQISGSATLESIRSRLEKNVNGINSVVVIENDSDIMVDSIPPHSIECIVSGAEGNDTGIAKEIFNSKGAGIGTYGNNTIQIVDSQGFNHGISFSRAISVDIYISITIEKNPEETFPTDGILKIKEELVKFGANYKIGEDVVIQKLYSSIYSIDGVYNADVLIGKTFPALLQENIPIEPRELAIISDGNIEIILN